MTLSPSSDFSLTIVPPSTEEEKKKGINSACQHFVASDPAHSSYPVATNYLSLLVYMMNTRQLVNLLRFKY